METILIVVEGTKAEPSIIDNIKENFLQEKTIIKILYGTTIYHLYERIKEDEDIDIVEILREMSDKNRKILENVKRRYVSSIFLFFDQDSHASNSSKEKLEELLEYFDNEYDKGKLYISYPMVEALRDIEDLKCESINLNNFCWNTIDNTSYKEKASQKIRHISFLSKYTEYSKEIWNIINKFNWRKANLLINKETSLPNNYDELIKFTQKVIYLKQLKLMNSSGDENIKNVIVLSAFPFFIADYLKRELIEDMIKS